MDAVQTTLCLDFLIYKRLYWLFSDSPLRQIFTLSMCTTYTQPIHRSPALLDLQELVPQHCNLGPVDMGQRISSASSITAGLPSLSVSCTSENKISLAKRFGKQLLMHRLVPLLMPHGDDFDLR